MALSPSSQLAVVLSAFLVPVLTYLYFNRSQSPSKSAGPLPPPTEITKLFIHPIKSCHGIEVHSAKLLPTGLDLDRQWMWVTYPDYKFLTIRNFSKMTTIRPSYNAETDTLTVTAPAPNSVDEKLQFSIPAHPTKAWLSENTDTVDATIWSTNTPVHCYKTSLTGPFNDFFGKEVRLVHKSPLDEISRGLVSNGAPKILGRVGSTCFPDLMPILVGSEKSIEELNSRIEAAEKFTIPVQRFRPNVLVRGDEPWDEDRWKTLHISPAQSTSWFKKTLGLEGITLDITQRCARCHVPNVDTETGEEHKRQPWDILMKYRRIDEGITYKPCFGMLCVPRGSGGEIKVGMKLSVTEVTDKHRYVAGF